MRETALSLLTAVPRRASASAPPPSPVTVPRLSGDSTRQALPLLLPLLLLLLLMLAEGARLGPLLPDKALVTCHAGETFCGADGR